MTVDATWRADAAFGAADDVAVISTTTDSHAATSASSKVFERFESDEQLKAWLLEAAVAEWGQLFGKPSYPWHARANWVDSIVGSGSPFFVASDDYSNTNVQVAGVDEADLVETDGEYLYLCSDGALLIIKAGFGDDLTVVSRIQLEDQPVGMYLDGNRLAIVSSTIAVSGFDGGFRILGTDRVYDQIAGY
jgi:uncharacterized secreted protein with C-terminal beta-propeller domain